MIYPPNQKPPPWPIDPGIIAYNCQKAGMPHPILAMPMWERAKNLARDYSGHGNHGALTNNPIWSDNGIKFDYTADPETYIAISPFTVSLSELSIVVSVKYNTAPNTYQWLYAGSDGTYNRLYLYTDSNDRLNIRFGTAAAGVSTDTLENNKNYSLAVTMKDGIGGALGYVDGKQVCSSDGASIAGNINADIIGAYPFTLYGWNGIIYSMLFFYKKLSAAQVKFLSDNPYFMYQIPEELYGYVAGAPPTGNPFWYYNMLKRRNA